MSSENLQMLFTAIVSVATVVYAILTFIIVKETIRLREAQTEPEIIVYLQPSEDLPSIWDIVVRNIGEGTAYKIKWEFDQDAILVKERGSRLDEQNFFTKEISYFAPGQVYRSIFGVSAELLASPAPPALMLRVSFENRKGKKYRREYSIDPMQFYGRTWVGRHGIREIAESLKDMQKDLSHVVSGFSRLNINTFDASDRTKAHRAEQKHFAEQRKLQGKKKTR